MKQEKGVHSRNACPDASEDPRSAGIAARVWHARRIEQSSSDLLSVNQGTLYPVPLWVEQEGAIASGWGPSENNRRTHLYRLTRACHKLLKAEKRDWDRTGAIIARFFEVKVRNLA